MPAAISATSTPTTKASPPSSRIFVRGLPPTLSPSSFRTHFSAPAPATDARLFPQRRIGYVGYRTPGEAERAVRYFNKSFIGGARIFVEVARAVADPELNKLRRTKPTERGTIGPAASSGDAIGLVDHGVKRKREERREVEDPKLREFLEVMRPKSKSRLMRGVAEMSGGEARERELEAQHDGRVQQVQQEQSEGEEEPQVIEKKHRTRAGRGEEEVESAPQANPNRIDAQQWDAAPALQDKTGSEDAVEAEEARPQGSKSDADWLRSRTNRLLDLEEDDGSGGRSKLSGVNTDGGSETQPMADDTGSAKGSVEAAPASVNDDSTKISEVGPHEDLAKQAIRKSCRLFLRNLSYDVSEDGLREHFSQFGEPSEVHVPMNTATGSGKGFAYVQFEDSEPAIRALDELDGTFYQGRILHVLPAAAKRDSKLDEFEISKMPLKKQRQIKRKSEAASSLFNWNALYMNSDAVMSSVADRLGVNKSDLLDPSASDAAVKQAHAETHVIADTKAYFSQNGVDLDAFKRRERGDTAILVKNFPYGTKSEELRKLFDQHGEVKRLLMPPTGTIAVVEFAQAPQARAAFHTLAYRKFKDSVLFLEKAPRDLFKADARAAEVPAPAVGGATAEAKLSAADLLQREEDPPALDTSTLYVRNLNFATSAQRLTEVFRPLDGFVSATVKTKSDPKRPGQSLSMGFGFLEFRNKAQAEAALSAMSGYDLDGHRLVLKASHRGLDAAEEQRREARAKKAASRQTKIIIKNLPFEATKKDVRAIFGAYGQLRSLRMPKKFDSSTRGFAFADFTSAREAESAMDALRNTHLLGRRLVLEFAAEDPEDAEEQLEKMQQKVGRQLNTVALQRLTGAGRKKFTVGGGGGEDDGNGLDET